MPTFETVDIDDKIRYAAQDATKCPVCERYIFDSLDASKTTFKNKLFRFRYDLASWVCNWCDAKLGIDTGRVKALSFSSNPNAVREFTEQYEKDAAQYQE